MLFFERMSPWKSEARGKSIHPRIPVFERPSPWERQGEGKMPVLFFCQSRAPRKGDTKYHAICPSCTYVLWAESCLCLACCYLPTCERNIHNFPFFLCILHRNAIVFTFFPLLLMLAVGCYAFTVSYPLLSNKTKRLELSISSMFSSTLVSALFRILA